MDYFKIIKQKLFFIFDTDKEKLEIKPYRIWLFILSSFAILLILILLFGVIIFLNISSDKAFAIKQSGQRVFKDTLDKERLNNILEYYDDKRVLLEQRMRSPLRIDDPSF